MRLLSLLALLLAGNSLIAKEFDLTDSSLQWQLEHVSAKAAMHRGQQALRVVADGAGRRGSEHLAILKGQPFQDGVIELEVAGQPRADAGANARGFIGIAFRVQEKTPAQYEAFYLRPTNGRAEDQVRRNHSVQYISHPDHPWYRLRKEHPGKYESYVDLAPGKWTKVKVVVSGTDARLFVHGAEQPCLIVKDLKHGHAVGAIGLWIEPSTEAYFRNLRVTPAAPQLTPERLVGKWSYTGGEKNGQRLDAAHFAEQSVVFTKDQLTLRSRTADGPANFVLKYRLDATQKPAQVKLEITESPFGAGAKTTGIIRFHQGKLQLCYPPQGGDAPQQFEAGADSGFYLFELEKE